ncbi:MAG: carbon-nitrogen hydrolase [Patescibacteria group bacterium]
MKQKRNVTIAAIQTKVGSDMAANLERAVRMVRRAAKRGARIVCLPELFRTVYFPQYRRVSRARYAETIPGEATDAFARLAKELGIVVIVPVYERTKGGDYYNSAVVIDERGRRMPTYRKTHIPHDPLFYEKNYFREGRGDYRVYRTKFGTFAVLICYDQWFPEAARMAALAGADIIFYPTAIGYIVGERSEDGDWHDAWETVMRGHAIANNVPVIAANRVGREDRLRFWGRSFACDAFGKVIAHASGSREEVLTATLDLSHGKRVRAGWRFFHNRRPDTYRL